MLLEFGGAALFVITNKGVPRAVASRGTALFALTRSTNAGERSRGHRAVQSRQTGTRGRERHPHLTVARAASAARIR